MKSRDDPCWNIGAYTLVEKPHPWLGESIDSTWYYIIDNII